MNSIAIKKNVNILNITDNTKGYFSNIKKDDILHGVVENVMEDKVQVSISQIGKKVNVNKNLLSNSITKGANVDFKVKENTKDKIELDVINQVTEEDVLSSDTFKGVTSKDVFESYDFVDEQGKAESKPEETTEEESQMDAVYANAYKESLKRILKFENVDVLKMSLSEFVNVLTATNKEMLEGLDAGEFAEDSSMDLIDDTLSKMNEILELTDVQIENVSVNMIKNNEPLTLNNVFGNVYKQVANVNSNIDFDVEKFNEDIKKILSNENVEVTDENIENAKTLIKNEIDVTAENITKLDNIKKTIKNINKDEVVLNSIKNSMVGINDVSLMNEEEIELEVNEIKSNIDKVIDNDKLLGVVKKENKEEKINIKCFNDYAARVIDLENAEINEDVKDIKLSLNEIRLQLTTKSAYMIYSKGINLKLEPLKNIVNELKNANKIVDEQIAGQKLNEVNKELNELETHNMMIFKENKNGSIKFYANLNRELQKEDATIVVTNKTTREDIAKIYDNNMIESKYTLKGEHSIAKRNISEVLNMLGIEDTEMNEKCALILSLSDNEISMDSINSIKAAETKVNNVISKLTPKVTLSLIEDGIDITSLDLDDAIKIIDKKIEEIKIETDKHYLSDNINNSEQLYDSIAEMIVSNSISGDVKDAMLGIYKILNKINKYSDAGLGILNYEADAETNELNLNLREIFDATKVLERKQYGAPIDVQISDAFGNIEKIVNEDKTIKAMLDKSFDNLRQKMRENHFEIGKVAEEVKAIVAKEKINENIINLIEDDIKQMTLEDLKDVQDFESSKELMNKNVTSEDNLSNNFELANDVENVSRKMKNEKFTDKDEKNHLIELRKTRNKDVKDILDEYENSEDVYEKIAMSKQDAIRRIDSINKVLKLTDKSSNAISTTVLINEEYTNVNLYFDTDIDSNTKENTMIISMNLDSIGEIKVDARINNESKNIKLNYITSNEDAKNIIKNMTKEISNTVSSDYQIVEININGKSLRTNNNLYNNVIAKNNLSKKI